MATRSLLAMLIFWLLIIPLSFNFWGLDPALYSKFLLLDLSLLIVAIWQIFRLTEIRISRDVVLFFNIYGLYIALSIPGLILYHINPADGWFMWLHLFTLPVFVLLLSVVDSMVRISREQVSLLISILAGISIVVGLVQYAEEVSSSHWYLAASDVMRSTYAHKNIFSEVLLLTLPFSFYSGFVDRKWYAKITGIVTVFILILLLSRAVWIATGVAVFMTLSAYFIANRKWVPRWYHFFGLAIGLMACYGLYEWFIWRTDIGDRLADFYQKRDTIRERKHLWDATWHIIRLHPLFGSGMGSWKILNMRYGIVGLRSYTTFFQQPHNDYLWVLSEQGFIAFIAAGAAWIYILYRLIKQLFAKPSDTFLYCLLFALVGYGAYANLAFPRERVEHMLVLAFVAFFVLSSGEQKVSLQRYLLWPLCIVLITCSWWSANKMVGEIQLRKFFEARSRNDVGRERSALDAISPTYSTLDGTATPIDWYRGMLEFVEGNADAAAVDFDQAVKVNPYHAYSLANVGTCRNIKGDRTGAEKYFRLALDYSPGFPDAALNLCAMKFNEGQIDSAAFYLGMANDTIADPRYVKSMNVIMQPALRSILDSVKDEDAFHKKINDLSKNIGWQSHIFKNAYISRRTVKEQSLDEVFWSMRHQDHDSINAEYYENKFKQFKQ